MLYRGVSATSRRFESPAAGFGVPGSGAMIALGAVNESIDGATTRRLYGTGGAATAVADISLALNGPNSFTTGGVSAVSGAVTRTGTTAWTSGVPRSPWWYWSDASTMHVGNGSVDEGNTARTGATRTGASANPWAALHMGSSSTSTAMWTGGVCRVILAAVALAADKIRAICLGHGATIDRYLKPSQILSDFCPIGASDAGAMRVRNYATGGPVVTRIGVASAAPPYQGAQGGPLGVTLGDQTNDNTGKGDIVPQHGGLLGPYGSRTIAMRVKIVASAVTANSILRGVVGKWLDGWKAFVRTDGIGTNGTFRLCGADGTLLFSISDPDDNIPYVVGNDYYLFLTWDAEADSASVNVLQAGTTTSIYSLACTRVAAGAPRFAHPKLYSTVSSTDIVQPAHFLLYSGALGDLQAFREAVATGAYSAYDSAKVVETRRPGDTTQASCFVKTGLDRASQTREWERQGTDGATANEAIVIRPNKYGARRRMAA